jgi:hypothetical protein
MEVWIHADDQRVERRLRELIAAGQSLEDAVRVLHQDDGIGGLFICPAIEAVTGLPPEEAKRLVVRALFPLWHK